MLIYQFLLIKRIEPANFFSFLTTQPTFFFNLMQKLMVQHLVSWLLGFVGTQQLNFKVWRGEGIYMSVVWLMAKMVCAGLDQKGVGAGDMEKGALGAL